MANIKDSERCQAPGCRGGYVYYPNQLEPDYCSSCNGTGIAGNPLHGLLLMLGIAILFLGALWLLFG